MSRLPTPGSDNGTWGDILNDFLGVEHNADGSLKKASDIADAKAKAEAAIPASQLGAANGVAQLDSGSKLKAAQIPASIVTKSTNSGDTGKAIDAYTGAPLSAQGVSPASAPEDATEGWVPVLDSSGGYVWQDANDPWLEYGKPVGVIRATTLRDTSISNQAITGNSGLMICAGIPILKGEIVSAIRLWNGATAQTAGQLTNVWAAILRADRTLMAVTQDAVGDGSWSQGGSKSATLATPWECEESGWYLLGQVRVGTGTTYAATALSGSVSLAATTPAWAGQISGLTGLTDPATFVSSHALGTVVGTGISAASPVSGIRPYMEIM